MYTLFKAEVDWKPFSAWFAYANAIIHGVRQLYMAIISLFSNISLPNFAVVLILVTSFQLYSWIFTSLLVFQFMRLLKGLLSKSFLFNLMSDYHENASTVLFPQI